MKNKWGLKISVNRIAMGILLIIGALLIGIDALGFCPRFFSEVSAFSIIIGAVLCAWILASLIKLNIQDIFFPLAFLFILFEKQISVMMGYSEGKNLINNWLVLLIALLLHAGFILIMPKHKKKIDGKNIHFECCSDNSTSNNSTTNIGNKIIYIDCANFKTTKIENNLGATQVFFSNIDQYEGNGILVIDNNLGLVKINVPSKWSISADVDNSLGSVSIPNEEDDCEKSISIIIDNSVGAVQVNKV